MILGYQRSSKNENYILYTYNILEIITEGCETSIYSHQRATYKGATYLRKIYCMATKTQIIMC